MESSPPADTSARAPEADDADQAESDRRDERRFLLRGASQIRMSHHPLLGACSCCAEDSFMLSGGDVEFDWKAAPALQR